MGGRHDAMRPANFLRGLPSNLVSTLTRRRSRRPASYARRIRRHPRGGGVRPFEALRGCARLEFPKNPKCRRPEVRPAWIPGPGQLGRDRVTQRDYEVILDKGDRCNFATGLEWSASPSARHASTSFQRISRPHCGVVTAVELVASGRLGRLATRGTLEQHLKRRESPEARAARSLEWLQQTFA
jgi:hypothetical protein